MRREKGEEEKLCGCNWERITLLIRLMWLLMWLLGLLLLLLLEMILLRLGLRLLLMLCATASRLLLRFTSGGEHT